MEVSMENVMAERKMLDWLDERLVIVAGGPASGKTLLLLNMAYQQAKRGIPTGIISLEMDAQSVLDRIAATNALDSFSDISLHISSIPEMVNGHFFWNKMKKMAEDGVKTIVVDYIDLVWVGNARRAINDLVYFSIANPCVSIFVGKNLSRDAISLADSEQIFRYRRAWETAGAVLVTKGLEDNALSVFVAKNRHGRQGDYVKIKFIGE